MHYIRSSGLHILAPDDGDSLVIMQIIAQLVTHTHCTRAQTFPRVNWQNWAKCLFTQSGRRPKSTQGLAGAHENKYVQRSVRLCASDTHAATKPNKHTRGRNHD